MASNQRRRFVRLLFRWIGRTAAAAAAAGAAWVIWNAFQPEPITVETGVVTHGSLEVTIEEDGLTRAVDHFTVSAPIAGRMARIRLDEGSEVRAGETVAAIYPAPVDPVERRQLEERVQSAQAEVAHWIAAATRARAQHQQTQRDRERAEALHRTGDVADQSLERARLAESVASREVAAIDAQCEGAKSAVRSAHAALDSQQSATSRPVAVTAPARGRVLGIANRSERVVRAGEPLVTLGDAARLEAVVDVLSSEAVRITPGTPARLVNWGGPAPLAARVRRVEPAAFRKVSALGIEEQRVNVILDFVDSPGPLGDGYRVEAQIVVWRAEVDKLPAGALFRCGDAWCVFVLDNGAARRREVRIGHRNALEAELLAGLAPGERVILHPPNELADGAAVRPETEPAQR